MTGRRMKGSDRFMACWPRRARRRPGPPASSTRTFPPGVTPIWPVVTTRSPGFTPEATMTSSP